MLHLNEDEMAAEIRKRAGLSATSRLDLDRLCAALGVDVRQRRLAAQEGGVEACLQADRNRDRFRVEVDPTPRGGWIDTAARDRKRIARWRTRFRVCHEIAHIGQFERRAGQAPRRLRVSDPATEARCDAIARSLLVPAPMARELGQSAAGILKLQARFDVSLEVAVRAAAAARPDDGFALWWTTASEPETADLRLQWHNVHSDLQPGWRHSALTTHALVADGEVVGDLPSVPEAGNAAVPATVAFSSARAQVVAVAASITSN